MQIRPKNAVLDSGVRDVDFQLLVFDLEFLNVNLEIVDTSLQLHGVVDLSFAIRSLTSKR